MEDTLTEHIGAAVSYELGTFRGFWSCREKGACGSEDRYDIV